MNLAGATVATLSAAPNTIPNTVLGGIIIVLAIGFGVAVTDALHNVRQSRIDAEFTRITADLDDDHE